jgi:hypothetical protein
MKGSVRKKKPAEGQETPKLTKRQEQFVVAAADPHVKSNTEAAKIAGYSPKTASSIAEENLRKPEIFGAIEKRKRMLAELAQVTDQHIFGATAEIAFASIEDALDDSGHLDIAKAKRNGSISLIKKITRNPTKYGETVAIEFYPKDAAQARLGEYLGMKQQERANDSDVKLTLVKNAIESRAKERGVSFQDELKVYIELSPMIAPDLKEKLASELIQ